MVNVVLPLDTPRATPERVGGKALNLVRLTRAGFAVPPGVVVTTEAYARFSAANHLDAVVSAALTGLDARDQPALEAASHTIRAAFAAGSLSAALADEMLSGIGDLVRFPLAVRSSATAEDTADLSFAGQQDTFLNVQGRDALLAAVVECWSSLWTARAIGYRLAAGVDQRGVTLAVVVQLLLPAEMSGVLFTANPLTGRRGEIVIDAVPGLGEAFVSGLAEPDHIVVDTAGVIRERTRGSTAVITVPREGGGVESRPAAAERTEIGEERIAALVALGRAIDAEYGTPQDVEWAFVGDELHVLQSRPITTLFPVPEAVGGPVSVWFSFAAIQGLLEPMTPLGQEAIRAIFAGLPRMVGIRGGEETVSFLDVSAERLWVRVDGMFRSRLGHRIVPHLFAALEPRIGAAVRALVDDPALQPSRRLPDPAFAARLSGLVLRILPRLPRSLVNPAGQRKRLEDLGSGLVADAERREREAAAVTDPRERLAARATALRDGLPEAFPVLVPAFAPIMGPSLAMMHRLNQLARSLGPQNSGRVLETLRALDGNVTTAMDLSLWDVARTLRADPRTLALFTGDDAGLVAAAYLAGSLPQAAQRAIEGFLDRYGMRAVGEIDLGQPRWRERPGDVIRMLSAYVRTADPDQGPDAVVRAGRATAARAARDLEDALRRAPGFGPVGRLRAAQARFLVSRVRGLFGARETPKFTMMRVLGIIRQGLLESAGDLVADGLLDEREDIAFLRPAELQQLSSRPDAEWRALVAQRKVSHERERQRRQIPQLLVSDGRAFFEGFGDGDDGAILGSPVSPGVVEGVVHVVLDPRDAVLTPGEVLVCRGTDPAWTPLFLAAGGLVTEVGGLMTHGSVVARELGLPAVVGVHDATVRLVTGQRVRLDGTNGTIVVLGAEG